MINSIRLLAALFLLLVAKEPLYCFWEVNDVLSNHDSIKTNPEKDPLFNLLKNKVKQSLKQSWCSEDKINLLMDLTYIIQAQVCVEIGAFSGSSVLPVAATLQYLNRGKIYAIDAWSNEDAIRYMDPDDPNRSWWASVDMRAVRRSFDNLITSWKLKNVCIPIAKTSALALYEIPEIDFLHIDGDLSEEGSLYDTEHYLKKVKRGGYILLSNVYHTVNNKQTKLKAVSLIFESCEFISETDRDNTALFRKL
jgi:predicted O-methyltransferase YrrM